jgi:hypothetical protein
MTPPCRKVLLLIGSAKQLHTSTSESLGTYLLDALRTRGLETQSLFLHQSFRTDEANEALHTAIENADIVVFAFPVYFDSPPYHVIKMMEQTARRHRATDAPKQQRLLTISNCGFPEADHVDTALAICRQFAREASFEWVGGLALGGGEYIGGKPLAESGGIARNVAKALDQAADALAAGCPVPDKVIALMAKPLVPTWLFRFLGGIGWKRRARQFGATIKLYDRPFDVDIPTDSLPSR